MKKTKIVKNLHIHLWLLTTTILICNIVSAQNLSLTASVGGSNLKSDLNSGYSPSYKPDISIGATYDFTNRIRARTNISFLSVAADDAQSPNIGVSWRNLNVKTSIQELALMIEGDLLDNENNSVIPYAFIGGSVYHFDPHPLRPLDTVINGVYIGDVSLHSIGTEGQYLPGGKYSSRKYNLTQFNIQFGGGFRFEISDNVSLALEANLRALFTDYLDDVSANSYISKKEWDDGIAAAGGVTTDLGQRLQMAEAYSWRYVSQKGTGVSLPIPADATSQGINYKRGDPSKNDSYYSFQIRLNVRLQNLFFSSDLYTPSHRHGMGQLRNPGRVF